VKGRDRIPPRRETKVVERTTGAGAKANSKVRKKKNVHLQSRTKKKTLDQKKQTESEKRKGSFAVKVGKCFKASHSAGYVEKNPGKKTGEGGGGGGFLRQPTIKKGG